MTRLPEYIIPVKRIVLSSKTGDWCRLPYPGHPKGCPNYGKSSKCPPKAPTLLDYFDFNRPVYLVVAEFDLQTQIKKMAALHPDWSNRQCRCVLYWQGTVRKILKERTAEAMKLLNATAATACPEGMGLNVFATARLAGLKMDKTRRVITDHHIALIGERIRDSVPFIFQPQEI